MQNIQKNTPLANNHISVDCVVIGFGVCPVGTGVTFSPTNT